MYSARFEADNGRTFVFGKNGGNVFDMDLGSGVSVDIGTSQGFSQIGESVETLAVNGRPISVKGVLFQDVDSQKKKMRNVFAPFVAGKLIFEDGHYTRVFVQDPPSFSPIKNDGRFTMRLFAPFPYFYGQSEESVQIGGVVPAFSFPVNYKDVHKFGQISQNRFTEIHNNGDVKAPYGVEIIVNGESSNPVVTDLLSFEFLKINGKFTAGDTLRIYRDENNVLIATLTNSNNENFDIIPMIDEGSTFYELNVGKTLVSVSDDEGGSGMRARIFFNEVVVALYES